jgi:hypothetical protein
MTKMSNADRNQLILLLLQQELEARIGEQSRFFELARRDQPVIQPGMIDETKTEDAIREIWKRNGWAGLTSGWKPTTRQIAEKNHVDILTTLYDYLYRLTSGAVHFNPQVLLRTGWGKPIVRFSPKNLTHTMLHTPASTGFFCSAAISNYSDAFYVLTRKLRAWLLNFGGI